MGIVKKVPAHCHILAESRVKTSNAHISISFGRLAFFERSGLCGLRKRDVGRHNN